MSLTWSFFVHEATDVHNAAMMEQKLRNIVLCAALLHPLVLLTWRAEGCSHVNQRCHGVLAFRPPRVSAGRGNAFISVRTSGALSIWGNSPRFKSKFTFGGGDPICIFAAPGKFQLLCKATRYWLERPGMRSCPSGSDITDVDECREAYEQLKGAFRFKNKRSLVVLNDGSLGDGGVPRYCSIQIGNNPADEDNTPHFNIQPLSKGNRGLLGTGSGYLKDQSEFQSICKEPSFWRQGGGLDCPEGTQIYGNLACMAAYSSVRSTFPAKPKNLLQTGSWFHVPRGCAAPNGGSDSTPHLNEREAKGRGTYGTGLALVAVVAGAPRLFCVAGVALGDICLRFVWQAWRLVTSAFVLCGRRGTYGTGLALVAAFVAAGRWGAAPAWHLVTSAFVLWGRHGTW
eukprot:s3603_g4.t1